LELAFRDYVEVYDSTNDTSCSRTVPCIALYPCSNSTGSWERIFRSQWNVMLMARVIVDQMNAFDEDQVPLVPEL
jgi:hypothetical protein